MWRVHLLMLQCYFSWQPPCLIFQEQRLTHPQVLPSHDHISNTLKPSPGMVQSLKLRWFTRWSDGKKTSKLTLCFHGSKRFLSHHLANFIHVKILHQFLDPPLTAQLHSCTASCATGSSPSRALPFASPRKAEKIHPTVFVVQGGR